MENKQKKLPGHTFLARLGKKRLRPGRKKTTEWLLSQAALSPDSKVLEIACNMSTTTIEVARRFQCHITAIDVDKQALQKAEANIKQHKLEHLITLQSANAMQRPFPDDHFYVIINEAMLTMYPNDAKERLLPSGTEPGGKLLTHDIMVPEDRHCDDDARSHQYKSSTNDRSWLALFTKAGFSKTEYIHAPMTLLSIKGLIYDEGLFGTLRIFMNA